MKRYLLLVFLLPLVGCTDASRGKITSLGSSATIKCYSGGTLIYDGRSTGKVRSEAQSDGYYFRDEATSKMKEVSGDCDITYD